MGDSGWSAILGAGGAIFGFVVSRWIRVAESRARSHARLQALRAEVLECAVRAARLPKASHSER
jgi:hypothetical protein